MKMATIYREMVEQRAMQLSYTVAPWCRMATVPDWCGNPSDHKKDYYRLEAFKQLRDESDYEMWTLRDRVAKQMNGLCLDGFNRAGNTKFTIKLTVVDYCDFERSGLADPRDTTTTTTGFDTLRFQGIPVIVEYAE